jgi:hypothetical protein
LPFLGVASCYGVTIRDIRNIVNDRMIRDGGEFAAVLQHIPVPHGNPVGCICACCGWSVACRPLVDTHISGMMHTKDLCSRDSPILSLIYGPGYN